VLSQVSGSFDLGTGNDLADSPRAGIVVSVLRRAAIRLS
jgi:hypothetical protein